jgi:hypothetical protein
MIEKTRKKKKSKVLYSILDSIDEFIRDDRKNNGWVHDKTYSNKAYLRKSSRIINGNFVKVLDLASIEIATRYQRKGFFNDIVKHLHKNNPYQWLMIENTHNPIVVNYCEKRKFETFPHHQICYFLNKSSNLD